MAGPLPMYYAERRDDYLASAADADKKAALARDECARTGWMRVADGYRDLAARLVPDASCNRRW
jgi:hypothetical protein